MKARALKPPLAILLSLCGAYLAAMVWFLAHHALPQVSLLFLAPLALLSVYVALYHFQQFLFLMVFFIPLSIGVKNLGGGFGASFPGEVFLALSGLIAMAMLLQRSYVSKAVVKHPVTWIIGLQVAWIVVSGLTSSDGLVSAKFLAARLAYLLVFYFLFLHLFRDPQKMVRFFWLYLLGLVPVLMYSLNRLAGWGLSRAHSPDMADPFFDDHTVLGSCLCMILPATILFLRHRKTYLRGIRWNRLIWFAAPLALVSLALTFSRAAWMSAIAALAMYLLLRMRIRFRWLLGFMMALTVLLWVNQDAILAQFRSNKVASSEDVLETAVSVTNVTTDESNKERVNRWSSALRMYQERPWLGWGPGTYERNYGVFQISTEKTRISTMDGDRGDAHSEYLGVLAEQGIPGLALQLLLFLALLRCGMRSVYRHEDPRIRNLAIVIVLGLVTYFLHGGVNSFLDLDKAASLFWAIAAMVVALDLAPAKAPPDLLSS